MIGDSFTETHAMLTDAMERPGGVLEWAKNHNCEFGIDKFQLTDLSRKKIPCPSIPKRRIALPRPSLMIGPHMIELKECVIFLGVQIDREL
jgi:hypothetical protein